MDKNIEETLKSIIDENGPSIIEERRRCEAMLLDLCPNNRKKVTLLVLTLKEGIVSDIVKISQSVPINAQISRLSQKLIDEHAIEEDSARWAVETWATALGYKIDRFTPANNPSGSDNNPSGINNVKNSEPSGTQKESKNEQNNSDDGACGCLIIIAIMSCIAFPPLIIIIVVIIIIIAIFSS